MIYGCVSLAPSMCADGELRLLQPVHIREQGLRVLPPAGAIRRPIRVRANDILFTKHDNNAAPVRELSPRQIDAPVFVPQLPVRIQTSALPPPPESPCRRPPYQDEQPQYNPPASTASDYCLYHQAVFGVIETWASIWHPSVVSGHKAFTMHAFGDPEAQTHLKLTPPAYQPDSLLTAPPDSGLCCPVPRRHHQLMSQPPSTAPALRRAPALSRPGSSSASSVSPSTSSSSPLPLPPALAAADRMTAMLLRLVVLGTIILALLAGFGTVSSSWAFLPSRHPLTMPMEQDVLAAEPALSSIRDDLARQHADAVCCAAAQAAVRRATGSLSRYLSGHAPRVKHGPGPNSAPLQHDVVARAQRGADPEVINEQWQWSEFADEGWSSIK
ncbi:hypothetical protein B0H17DRAFT_1204879 [Mycena rosella]|uniref:Golgi pH regulator conserved domain-containing protein n=1 Tax=Mycena rosella TaxID=1033263 RepID=A0AAD7D916_MYCRO|nr:hypothetical protein B0H17DRAFT_1204879 [Mycena rosella]